MRILILSQYWEPENGVPQRRWAWLTGLATQNGHEVMVVAPPPHYRHKVTNRNWLDSLRKARRGQLEEGTKGETILRTVYVPSGMSLTSRIVNQLSVASGMLVCLVKDKRLRSFDPQLVIGTVPALPTAAIAWLCSKKFDIPFVLDLRDAWPDLLAYSKYWNRATERKSIRERFFGLGFLQALILTTEFLLNRCIQQANGIIVTSSELGKALTREPKNGDKPIICIRNVFPPVEYSAEKQKPPRDKSELRIIYAGTLGRAQNLANALRALEIVLSAGKRAKIRFIGEGASKSALVESARQRQLPVEFFPQCNIGEMAEHYRWADTALVHLTDWEPLKRAVPSKTYELMANRIHICGVALGEVADLLDEVGGGQAVPPECPKKLAELWIKLLENPGLLEVDMKPASWVLEQREIGAKNQFLRILEEFERRAHD